MIDDVRLYDVELMEHEVAELYNTYAYTDAGTPHSWLDAHGLVTGGDYEAADLLDDDGDELPNGKGYWAGTNPTNSASVIKLVGTEAQGDQMIFDWLAVSGKKYNVWFKSDLADGAWALQEAGIPGLEPSCYSTVQTGNATGFIQIDVSK